MKTPGKFLSSPYFLFTIPLVIAVILTAGRFNRFLLETESAVVLPKGGNIYFDDLDGDGIYESLYAFTQENTTGLTIRKNGDIIDQWNFKGTFDFIPKTDLFITGDRNGDGKKEVYVFTLNRDSILLHCISDYVEHDPSLSNRFIAKVGSGRRNPDPSIIPAEMQDLDGDGVKELIFGITTGFSVYPRNVFAYFIEKDSLIMSPESSYFIKGIMQLDITGDGQQEIIPYGYATGNVDPGRAKYHDYSSYLMVLDQDLEFLFEPLEFRVEYSTVTPFTGLSDNDSLLSFLYVPRSLSEGSIVHRINSKGRIIDSIQLGVHAGDCQVLRAKNGRVYYLMSAFNAGKVLFNSDFVIERVLPGKESCEVLIADLDHDDDDEFVIPDFKRGEISVYRELVSKPVSLSFITEGEDLMLISLAGETISLQTGQRHYLFRYRQHPWYPYFYLVYPLFYAAMIGIFITIRTIRRQTVYDNERRISQLQLALLKNQLDPHFTLNAINSIIYSAEFADKAKTGDQLRAFAGLFRNMLMSSADVQKTIKEELDFCRNYLLLEKMRFGKSFSYEIHVEDNVNLDLMIPKFSIQVHAENALKHGLSGIAEGGKLRILLKNDGNQTIIEVSDNGVGRINSNNESRNTTGKGLATMNELYRIYNRFYDEKISYEIIDLYNEEKKPSGTLVRITLKTY
jgi:hypothetical protein